MVISALAVHTKDLVNRVFHIEGVQPIMVVFRFLNLNSKGCYIYDHILKALGSSLTYILLGFLFHKTKCFEIRKALCWRLLLPCLFVWSNCHLCWPMKLTARKCDDCQRWGLVLPKKLSAQRFKFQPRFGEPFLHGGVFSHFLLGLLRNLFFHEGEVPFWPCEKTWLSDEK